MGLEGRKLGLRCTVNPSYSSAETWTCWGVACVILQGCGRPRAQVAPRLGPTAAPGAPGRCTKAESADAGRPAINSIRQQWPFAGARC